MGGGGARGALVGGGGCCVVARVVAVSCGPRVGGGAAAVLCGGEVGGGFPVAALCLVAGAPCALLVLVRRVCLGWLSAGWRGVICAPRPALSR